LQWGHEDQFPLFRLSARYWSSQETFAGVHASDHVGTDAPIPAFDDSRGICRVRTPKLSFKSTIGMAHRDPKRKSRRRKVKGIEVSSSHLCAHAKPLRIATVTISRRSEVKV
jgi:hypothetical protein